MNYCQVGFLFDGSDAQKIEKIISPLVSGSVVESATKYMSCYRLIACARSVWDVVESATRYMYYYIAGASTYNLF